MHTKAPDRARAPASDRQTFRPRRVTLIANTGWNIVRFRGELIRALIDRGWDVSVVAAFGEEHLRRMRELGARPIALDIDAAGHDPTKDLVYLAGLVRALRLLRPDLVHLFTIKPVVYGALAAKLVGVPGIVASVTGAGILRADRKTWLRPVLRGLVRAALAGRPVAIFQNPDDLTSFISGRLVAPSRATYVPGSGVDTRALTPDPSVPPAQRMRFVMASRMLWSKGVADFVGAARLVRRRHPAASFVLFGGAREDYASQNPDFIERAWLERLNREGIVEWRGWTDPADVEAAMRTAAAVVLPSWYGEGVPRSLIEAASAGAPIITTDMPGCRDTVIDGRSGFLCAARSPKQLADAMAELLRQPERIAAMGREGRQLAVTRFDQGIVIGQTLAVYDRAMASGDRRHDGDELGPAA